MTSVVHPYLSILPIQQRQLWLYLAVTKELGFTLYGGTAIALRLGHRESIDFDFFSEKPLRYDELYDALPFMRETTTLHQEAETLSVLTDSKVKLSFFGTIDFGRVSEPDITNDRVLYIASIEDLMATKVATILKRVESKDYKDIAAMINAGASLAVGLAGARALYGSSFQPSESLKALVYFKGGDLYALTGEEKRILMNAVGQIDDIPTVSIVSRQLTPEA